MGEHMLKTKFVIKIKQEGMPHDQLEFLLDQCTSKKPPEEITKVLDDVAADKLPPFKLPNLSKDIMLAARDSSIRSVYLSILLKVWRLGPQGTIAKDNYKYLETLFEDNTNSAEILMGLVEAYSQVFECPASLIKAAKNTAKDDYQIILLKAAAFASESIEGFRIWLEPMVCDIMSKEPVICIRIASKLKMRLDESVLQKIKVKDWQKYVSAVVDYYQQLGIEGLEERIAKWLDLYSANPSSNPISFIMLEPMSDLIKRSLKLQEAVVKLLLFLPMRAVDKNKWTSLLNLQVLESIKDVKMRALMSTLSGTLAGIELQKFNADLRERPGLDGLLRLCKGFAELKVKIMPEATAEEEAEFRREYTAIIEEAGNIVVPRYFSCGALRRRYAGRQGQVYINNPAVLDNLVIDCQKVNFEVIVAREPAEREMKLYLEKENISLPLEIVIKMYLDHNKMPHPRLNAKLHVQLMQEEIVLKRVWSQRWNYLITAFPQLFSAGTKLLWLRAVLGPERYLKDTMVKQTFTINKRRVLKEGVKLLRAEADTYVTIEIDWGTQEFYSCYSTELAKALLEKSGEARWSDLGILLAQAVLDERNLELTRIELYFKHLNENDSSMRSHKEQILLGIKGGINQVCSIWPFSLEDMFDLIHSSN